MERRVYVYNNAGKELGHVRLDTDDVGSPVAEVYDEAANKMGAIRWEMLNYGEEMSLVHEPDGRQMGTVRLRRDEDSPLRADVYFEGRAGTEPELMARVQNAQDAKQALVFKKDGEPLGTLKPEQVSPEELALVGGGAALLILL